MGGTLELFHAGLALILLGAIGWFMRHGPLNTAPATPALASFQSTQPTASSPVKHAAVKPEKGKSTKVKASTVKRRQKKAKTRRQHVQR